MSPSRIHTVQLAGAFLLGSLLTYVAFCGQRSTAHVSKAVGIHSQKLLEAEAELRTLSAALAREQRDSKRAEPPKQILEALTPTPENRPAPSVVSVQKPKARVALCLSFDQRYIDGARVLSHSVHKRMSAKWPIQMVALLAPKVFADTDFLKLLRAHEYIPIEAPLEFNSSRIKTHKIARDTLRKEIDKSGCCGMSELIKLTALKLTEYEWVVIGDADLLVLKNLDNLFEEKDAEVQYTKDLLMGGGCVNGGFALMRPSEDVYHQMWGVVEEGDWRPGTAWGGKNIGYCYGGPTFQGLIPYFYQHVHKPTVSKRKRIVVLDSCLYNNMGTNTNAKGRQQGKVPIGEVSVIHFTFCQKPWMCYGHSGEPICAHMHKAWWRERQELEKKAGYPVRAQCHGGPNDYPSLPKTCPTGSDECE